MTDGTPGWYLDRDDSALARWHDGTEWTEHTLVIADQEPGSDPPPPPAARRPSDAALQRERVAAAEERRAAREAAAASRSGYPRWVPVAVAALVGLLAAGAFAVLGGDDDGDTTQVDTEEAASIDEAVDAARDAGFPDQIGDARLSGLIEDLCEAADRPARTATLNAQLTNLPLEPAELSRAIRALGEGAEVYCPASEDGIATALGQLRSQDDVDPTGLPTDTTLPSVDGGVVDGSVTTVAGAGGGTATTSRSSTATTRRPTTATTAAPTTTASTAPPTTTTTIQKVSPTAKACSPEGAVAVQAGQPVTCKPKCGTGPLEWSKANAFCPTTSIPTN